MSNEKKAPYTLSTAIKGSTAPKITKVTLHGSFKEATDEAMKTIERGSKAAMTIGRAFEAPQEPESLELEHGGTAYRFDRQR